MIVYELPIKEKTRHQDGWTFSCLFCDETVTEYNNQVAEAVFTKHAKKHYWYPADAWMDDDSLDKLREQRRRYQNTMPGYEGTQQMNREGL